MPAPFLYLIAAMVFATTVITATGHAVTSVRSSASAQQHRSATPAPAQEQIPAPR